MMTEREHFVVSGTGPSVGIPEFPLLIEGRERAMRVVADHLGKLIDREKMDARDFLEGNVHWFRTLKWGWKSDDQGHTLGLGYYVTIQKVKIVP